ncbi:MAG TPA: NnrS family protein, partial [Steroidobacteraceae bacterium]|nr:NnrS family protein [Steroidobacteraceae bacterium]
HAHEMLFGFIGAAVAGFLLTAVPSWTGQRGFAGGPLLLLVSVWLAGRVLVAMSSYCPLLLCAVVDCAFLPLLAALLLPPLLRGANRNTRLLPVLAALALVNVVFYIGLAQGSAALARGALLTGVNLVLLLVTVIGGRVLPAFTSAALRQRDDPTPLRRWWGIDTAAVAAMVAVLVVDLLAGPGRLAGAVALSAAVLQALRLYQWRSLRTFGMPILWVLHLAYAWLPLGLALKALALLWGIGAAWSWVHALTIGVAALMTLGIMSRAALGHTGRPLVAQPLTACAYVLLAASAASRAFGPATGASYATVIAVAALLWTAAFGIFLWVYTPILCAPRIDGRPG